MVNLLVREEILPFLSGAPVAPDYWWGALVSCLLLFLEMVRVENLFMVQSSPENNSLREGIFSIQLHGPVAMATVPEIRKVLLGAAKKRTVKEIRIDFSRVTILDTSGVAMLVETWRSLARRGGALRLSGLGENAKRLIHLAGLDQIFEILDDPGSRIEYGS